MTVLVERELEFTFPSGWNAQLFDAHGVVWPQGIKPVDFLVERESDMLLIEVKDPSASKASEGERTRFARQMASDELTHQNLAPKARSTWCYLHLMGRAQKPIRFIVVIDTQKLSLQPLLMMQLNDRLKKRLYQEAEAPWVNPYVVASAVLTAQDIGSVLPGVTVRRIPSS